jgi:arginase
MTDAFVLIGVPIDSVGRSGGTELAPGVLRDAGLSEALAARDFGDLHVRVRGEDRDPLTGIVGSHDVLATTATIRDAVAEVLSGGERPFLAGGCCTEVPGALAGARDVHGRVGLAYVDGHVDLYDGVTSPTGEAADMPVSVVLGLGPDGWVGAAGGASVTPGDAQVLGARDLEEALADGMRHPDEVGGGFALLDVEALRAEGPAAVGDRVAGSMEAEPGRFWLHLDVDVLDEVVFPATDYLLPGGMDWGELEALLRPLAASPALLGASIACYNPDKDPGGAHGRALVDAMAEVFAGSGGGGGPS